MSDCVDGFFHTTTNLPGVAKAGRLLTRSHLGSAAGLGGGVENAVSVTHCSDKSAYLEEHLRLAVRVAQERASFNEVVHDYVLRFGLRENGATLEQVAANLSEEIFRYIGWTKGATRPLYRASTWAEFGRALRDIVVKHNMGYDDLFALFMRCETVFGKTAVDFAEIEGKEYQLMVANVVIQEGQAPVVLARFAAIEEKNIATLELSARRDSHARYNEEEWEVLYYPKDLCIVGARKSLLRGRR
jgi:hypothetical protein